MEGARGRARGRGRAARRCDDRPAGRVGPRRQRMRVLAPHRRRAPVHRRSRRVRREPRPRRQARRRARERGAQVGEARRERQARRLRGRPDPGERIGRGGDEARQVRQGERRHRRDGVDGDDPDGAVRDHPEPDRPDLADIERAADLDDQGQRLPVADLPVRRVSGAGARAGRRGGVRSRRHGQRRRAQRCVRDGAAPAVQDRVHEARRQDRRERLVEPGSADLRHRGAAARRRRPGGS